MEKLSNVINFRPIEGYVGAKGKRIKVGYFFRSGVMEKLEESDKEFLSSLGIQSIIDLRDHPSIEKHPDWQIPGAKYIETDVLAHLGDGASDSAVNLDSVIIWGRKLSAKEYRKAYLNFLEMYRLMPYSHQGFSPLFEAMDRHEKILFNCTGGKDRTGVAAMIVMLSLGCSEKDIIKNYLLSNEYRRERNHWRVSSKWKETHSLIGVHYQRRLSYVYRKYIKLSLKAIFDKYQTKEDFFREEYGISKEQLSDWQSFYLE